MPKDKKAYRETPRKPAPKPKKPMMPMEKKGY